jgi:hypothetical protein
VVEAHLLGGEIDIDLRDRGKVTADVFDQARTALTVNARDGNECFHRDEWGTMLGNEAVIAA